jgi:hypothetical protein
MRCVDFKPCYGSGGGSFPADHTTGRPAATQKMPLRTRRSRGMPREACSGASKRRGLRYGSGQSPD